MSETCLVRFPESGPNQSSFICQQREGKVCVTLYLWLWFYDCIKNRPGQNEEEETAALGAKNVRRMRTLI